IKRVHAALAETPLQAVLQKMCAPRVEIHAAFLINQGLQQPQFGFAELDRYGRSTHRLFLLLLSGRGAPGFSIALGSCSFSRGTQVEQLRHIQENDQSAFAFAQASNAVQTTFLKRGWRWLNVS